MDTGLEDLYPVLVVILIFAAAVLLIGYLFGWFDNIPDILSAFSRKFMRF